MKKCPFCAEEIQSDAIICRYCHSMLTDDRRSAAAAGQHSATSAAVPHGAKIGCPRCAKTITAGDPSCPHCGSALAFEAGRVSLAGAAPDGVSSPKPTRTGRPMVGYGCLTVVVVFVLMIIVGSLLPDQKPAPARPRSPSASPAAAPAASAPPKDKEADCRADLRCWAEKHLIEASVRCDDRVEAMAQYSAEWTDGFLEPKFSRYRWQNASAGVVTYLGDKVRFQNGFGAWQNMVYACDYDPASERVVDVTVTPGRLPE